MKSIKDIKLVAFASFVSRLTIWFTIAGTTKLDLNFFQISDLRVFLPVTTLLSFVLLCLDKNTRKILCDYFGRLLFMLFSVLLLLSALLLYTSPTIYTKLIFTIILLTLNFFVFSVLTKFLNPKNHFLKLIVHDSLLAGLVVCGISFIALIGRQNGLNVLFKVVESSNFRYLQYDFLRGRIFPLFPPTYLIGIATITYLDLFKKSKKILNLTPLFIYIIALFSSNYRILIMAGLILTILTTVRIGHLDYKKILVLFIIASSLPGIILSTNVIKRISLIDTEDADSINGRFNIVKSFVSQSINNGFQAVGFGNATEEADRVLENKTGQYPTNQNPHNIYLQLLVEGGAPIVLTYLVMILYLLVLDIKIIRNPDVSIIEQTIALTCITFYVTSVLERHQLNVFVFIFSIQGILFGNSEIIKNGGKSNNPSTNRFITF